MFSFRKTVWASLLLSHFLLGAGFGEDLTQNELYQTTTLPNSNLTMSAGQTQSLVIDGGWRHVDKLFIQAEAYGAPATLEVIANGDVKGSIVIPQVDPPFVVTIGETVSSIELRQLDGGQVHIDDVKAVETIRALPEPGPEAGIPAAAEGLELPNDNQARWLAGKAIAEIDEIRPYVNLETEYVVYLLPVKSVAGRAFAIASVEGDRAQRTRDALDTLCKQIDFAEPMLDSLLKGDLTFELGVKLIAVRQEIERVFLR